VIRQNGGMRDAGKRDGKMELSHLDQSGDAPADDIGGTPVPAATALDIAYRCRNDSRRTMEFITEGVHRITGFRPADFIARHVGWAELVQPDGVDWASETARLARAGRTYQLTYRIRHRNGSTCRVSERGQGILDEAGTLIAFEGFITELAGRSRTEMDDAATGPGLAVPQLDVTQRPRMVQPLPQSEAYCRALLEALPSAAYACDARGRIIFFNEQAAALWGRRPLLGDPDQLFCGSLRLRLPDGTPLPHDRTPMSDALRTGNPVRNQEVVIEQPDGQYVPVLVNIDPLLDTEGQAIGAINSFHELTAQRQAEKALKDSQERLCLALDAAYLISFEWDIRRNEVRRFVSSDPVLSPTPEPTPDTFEAVRERVHPDDRSRFTANVIAALHHPDGRYENEFRIVHPDGKIIWLFERGRVERDSQGRPARLLGLSQDITARKQTEEALRERERELLTLTDHVPDIIGRLDRQLRHVFISPAIRHATGKSVEEYLGKTNEDLGYPPELCEAWSGAYRDVFETGQPRELPFTFSSPQGPLHFSLRAVPEVGPDGTVDSVVFITRDVTSLTRAEERARLALEAGDMGTWDLDLVSGVAVWNEAGYRMLGYEPEEVTPSYETWAARVHPDDLAEIASRHRQVLDEGGDLRGEFRVIHPDGTLRWMESRGRVERDAGGRPTRSFGVMLDITARKESEEALREADRRKNEFLAILAHELRNPLAPIRNAVDILKLTDPSASQQSALDMIDRQLRHLVRLIDDLLDVSRITRGKLQLRRERVALTELVQQVLEVARPQAERAGHRLSVSLPQEPVALDVDPVRLVQVLLNLLDNACKYTERGGQIRLSAMRDGTDLVVEVSDNGIGIPPEHLPNLFQLFAQVNDVSEASRGGLGIGLALVRGLVELHGGRIEAMSPGPGQGSLFSVRLPALGTPLEAAQCTGEPDDLRPAASLHCLVVDDNVDSAESLALLLDLVGYRVSTAHDGLAAVDAAARDHPDVVLLDLGMPKLDGFGACRRLRAECGDRTMRIIALTGWGQDDDRRKTKEAGFDGHLVKPVELPALLRLLADAQAPTDPASGKG
jgi:PAS domain S-box-containing protein